MIHDMKVGIITVLVALVVYTGSIALLSHHSYRDCPEDAVWAWQQNGGDFPDHVKWDCVALDDLVPAVYHDPAYRKIQ